MSRILSRIVFDNAKLPSAKHPIDCQCGLWSWMHHNFEHILMTFQPVNTSQPSSPLNRCKLSSGLNYAMRLCVQVNSTVNHCRSRPGQAHKRPLRSNCTFLVHSIEPNISLYLMKHIHRKKHMHNYTTIAIQKLNT